MKKIIFGLALIFVTMSCFGEVYSARASYENISAECFWNSKAPPKNLTSKEIKEMLVDFYNETSPIIFFYTSIIIKTYRIKKEVFMIVMSIPLFATHDAKIEVRYKGVDGYEEILKETRYDNGDEARKVFDKLCSEYYKKVAE